MKKKASIGEKVFDCFNIFLMLLIVFVTLYPFWYVAIISLNDGMDAGRGGVYFLPRVFTLQNYQVVFQNPNLVRAFMVTLVRTVVGTFMSVLFTSFMAYALTHKHLLFRRFYIIIGIITMFFSAGLIPYYLTIRNLGLRNSFWVYIFPALFNFYVNWIY